MLEVYCEYYKKWIPFIVLKSPSQDDVEDERSLDNLPIFIYGKQLIGVAFNQPVWMYGTVKKSKLKQKS